MKFVQFCTAHDMTSAEDLSEIIKAHKLALQAMSDTWSFEHCLLSLLCGKTAEERCAHSIMQLLPTPDRHADMKTVIGRLELMKGGELMKMSPIAVQAACEIYLYFVFLHF